MCAATPHYREELIAGYVLGNLSPQEASEFRRLLAEYPELRLEVDQLQETLELLAYELPQVAAPQHLRTAILAASESRLSPPRYLSWSKVWATVAVVCAIALSIDNYMIRRELAGFRDAISVLQHPETYLFNVQGQGNAANATGSILMNLDDSTAVVAVQNLPLPPQGQAYWLWAIVDGKMQRCGQFNVLNSNSSFDQISMPSEIYQEGSEVSKLLITLESSQTPTFPSSIVMVSHSS